MLRFLREELTCRGSNMELNELPSMFAMTVLKIRQVGRSFQGRLEFWQ
jgi:hypothetical protein